MVSQLTHLKPIPNAITSPHLLIHLENGLVSLVLSKCYSTVVSVCLPSHVQPVPNTVSWQSLATFLIVTIGTRYWPLVCRSQCC